MRAEFRRIRLSQEMRSLLAFDRKTFSPSDRFPAEYWKQLESWWMLIDGVKVGCSAFERHVDIDLRSWGSKRMPGSLFIASTAILPRFQHHGFGQLLKSWQIAYARRHGFTRIVTTTRRQNKAMISLNRKFRFRVIGTIARYYADPEDSAVVMELRLPSND